MSFHPGVGNTAVTITDKPPSGTSVAYQCENITKQLRIFNGRAKWKGSLSVSLGKHLPLFLLNIITTRIIANIF